MAIPSRIIWFINASPSPSQSHKYLVYIELVCIPFTLSHHSTDGRSLHSQLAFEAQAKSSKRTQQVFGRTLWSNFLRDFVTLQINN